jgi:hypothetical protein
MDACSRMMFRRSHVDGRVLADDVVHADHKLGGLAVEAQHLRRAAQHRKGIDAGPGADARLAGYVDVRTDLDAGPQLDLAVDHGAGADFGLVVDLRARVDDGGGMDLRHVLLSLSDCTSRRSDP